MPKRKRRGRRSRGRRAAPRGRPRPAPSRGQASSLARRRRRAPPAFLHAEAPSRRPARRHLQNDPRRFMACRRVYTAYPAARRSSPQGPPAALAVPGTGLRLSSPFDYPIATSVATSRCRAGTRAHPPSMRARVIRALLSLTPAHAPPCCARLRARRKPTQSLRSKGRPRPAGQARAERRRPPRNAEVHVPTTLRRFQHPNFYFLLIRPRCPERVL